VEKQKGWTRVGQLMTAASLYWLPMPYLDSLAVFNIDSKVLGLPSGVEMLRSFQLQVALPPDQALCPGTLLGALLPDPYYRLATRARHVP